jgi:hypothetical protein
MSTTDTSRALAFRNRYGALIYYTKVKFMTKLPLLQLRATRSLKTFACGNPRISLFINRHAYLRPEGKPGNLPSDQAR